MTLRRDMTLPTLLLAPLTVYGFLLVWAQNSSIELTTTIGDHANPISPSGFNIVTGKNVSIELDPWHNSTMAPAVSTPAPDPAENTGSPPTAAPTSGAGVPHALTDPSVPPALTDPSVPPALTDPNVSPALTDSNVSPALTDPNVSPAGTSPHTTVKTSNGPRSIKKSRAVTNSTGRVSIKVKIQSSAPRDKAMALFLQKACEFFMTMHLEDVMVTLGPERNRMLCSTSVIN